jgi:prepilin-type N-terminal cleavage/methylation domain-containing protein
VRGAWLKNVWKDRRGYTLPEVLTAVAIAGVLAAISVTILLALLERWRVEAAADQLAADMRLAHTSATQQLADWRVVLMHDGAPLAACSEADYCLVKLKSAYDAGDGPPALDPGSPLRRGSCRRARRSRRSPSTRTAPAATRTRPSPRAVAGPSPRGPSSSTRTGR